MSHHARQIQNILNNYFPNPEPPLHHTDPYTLLIAVLLSARCTDARVNQVTPALFKVGGTPERMARLSIEEIRALIKTCGLSPTKAKHIHQLSVILIKKYKGKVPKSLKALEALPGVGHKTASVVMAQAFHVPAFPVDTHIFRCAHKWGLSRGKTREKVEADLKRAFPRKDWIKVHLQIIYFARKFCQARGKHTGCPICSSMGDIARS